MSDHTDDITLTDTERDSLTECECGHYLNEHSSEGCLATVYDGDDGMASLDDVCACIATPDVIRERAITAIVAARVAQARAQRDQAWIGAVTLLLRAVTTNDATFDAVLPDLLAQARATRDADWQRHLNALPDDMAEAWGGDATWLTTGNKVATLVGDWLADLHYDLTPTDQGEDHG